MQWDLFQHDYTEGPVQRLCQYYKHQRDLFKDCIKGTQGYFNNFSKVSYQNSEKVYINTKDKRSFTNMALQIFRDLLYSISKGPDLEDKDQTIGPVTPVQAKSEFYQPISVMY